MGFDRRRTRFLLVLTATLAVGAAAGCGSHSPATTSGDSTALRPIAGGRFEASGAAFVPESRVILFVDDGRAREVLAMELAADGSQLGPATPVRIDAKVTDLEGITTDGTYFYMVGSQSKQTGFDGDGLVRFTFDAASRTASGVASVRGLKAWLAKNVAELRGTERRVGDHVLNIEAIAWDPGGRRLLLGLRAPVVDGQALIIPVRLADSTAPFTRENLRVDGPAIRLDLGGAGIRSLEYDAHAGGFRLITGASLDAENRDFGLMEWDGKPGSAPKLLTAYARRFKPEGVTRAMIDGRPVTVIVFDTGFYLVSD